MNTDYDLGTCSIKKKNIYVYIIIYTYFNRINNPKFYESLCIKVMFCKITRAITINCNQ